MVAIIDYGVGNLFSLVSSLKQIGVDAVITGEPEVIKSADRLILPGVGAFADAYDKLITCGLAELIKTEATNGKPLLGICLGMQLLFEESFEFGHHKGLGLISGSVVPMKGKIPDSLNIPHMGWNKLEFTNETPIFKYINNGDFVYFVHSFYAACDKTFVTSQAEYGIPLTASVQNGNVFGCQFHPEKSGETGLAILKAFCEMSDKL
jgi:glutamine amidotransferase